MSATQNDTNSNVTKLDDSNVTELEDSNITKFDDSDLLLMKNFNQNNFDALLEKLGGTNWTNENQQTLLHIAAEKGYYEAAKALIDKDPRLINTTDKFHQLSLHHAAQEGKCDIVSLLLENGANVNALAKDHTDDPTTEPDVSPLHFATAYGHDKCVRVLLDHGASVNHADKNGWTALHYAAQEGKCDMISLLIEKGTSVDALAKYSHDDPTTKASVSPLILAAKAGKVECVRVFLDHGADVNRQSGNGWTALHHAARNGHCDIVSLLIEKGANVNTLAKYSHDDPTTKPHVSSLQLASKRGHTECVQILLDHGADINHKDIYEFTAFHYAAQYGHCDLLPLLIEKGANVNALAKYSDDDPITEPHVSPLLLSAADGKVKCVQTLLDHGADVNHADQNGWTALHFAARMGHCGLLPLLIEKGANVNALAKYEGEDPTTKAYVSPLRLAAIEGHSKCVQILLDNKADVNHKDMYEFTAFHYAAWNGRCDLLPLLLENGASVDALAKYKNDDSTTKPHVSSLQFAAHRGHVECVRVLLDHGASIDHEDKDGWTALHQAARFGKFEVVEMLADAGADIFIKNKNGDTALKLAKSYGKNEQIIEYLQEYC